LWAALIVVFIPFAMLYEMPVIVPFVPIGTFVFGFLVTRWMLRRVPSRRILHGTLIGILATAIYVILGLVQPGGIGPVVEVYGPFLFVLANGLRIVGCGAAGFGRRSY
jgi:hypothetical protein